MSEDQEDSKEKTSTSVDEIEEMDVGVLIMIAKDAAKEIPGLLKKVDGVDVWDKEKLEALYKNRRSKLNFITRPAGTLENRTQSPLSKLNYSGGGLDRIVGSELAKKMRQLATLRMTGNDPLEEEADEIIEEKRRGVAGWVRRVLGRWS